MHLSFEHEKDPLLVQRSRRREVAAGSKHHLSALGMECLGYLRGPTKVLLHRLQGLCVHSNPDCQRMLKNSVLGQVNTHSRGMAAVAVPAGLRRGHLQGIGALAGTDGDRKLDRLVVAEEMPEQLQVHPSSQCPEGPTQPLCPHAKAPRHSSRLRNSSAWAALGAPPSTAVPPSLASQPVKPTTRANSAALVLARRKRARHSRTGAGLVFARFNAADPREGAFTSPKKVLRRRSTPAGESRTEPIGSAKPVSARRSAIGLQEVLRCERARAASVFGSGPRLC